MPGRAFLVAAACGALWLAAAAPATAVPLPGSPSPLPDSAFQGADGDQDDAPPYTDWAGTQAAGRVTHSPDPNAQDDVFAGGSKENEPGEWDIVTSAGGATPAADNILDGWSSVDQAGANTFLYLAFAREKGTGTSFVTFELNRDGRLWDNGRARVPCRLDGDVLITFEPHGNDLSVFLDRWETTSTDPATNCARTGRVVDSTEFTANVDVQGALNATTIANALPGAGDSIDTGRFGEAAINLAKVLGQAFGDSCLAFTSLWMHSRSSTSDSSAMKDYVAPRRIEARTCAAAGTKFLDLDADGVRDPGEPGLPRFKVYADYDGDGRHDAGEPFTVTDDEGDYVLDDIRPPDGTYTLREALLERRGLDWQCSLPNAGTPGGFGDGPGPGLPCGWGPIDPTDVPYARDRDFGNWVPARLTLRKELSPPGDPGRFDLLVNGQVLVAGAGDGDQGTIELRPGTYSISETLVSGTGEYDTVVDCKAGTRRARRAGGLRAAPVTLTAGARVTCTFRNTRQAAPAIAIDKTGPATAEWGETLRYRLFVSNVGEVPFAAGDVRVRDPRCDDPPELEAKQNGAGATDPTPGTLDPGDVWSYRCSQATRAQGDDCEAGVVPNAATVTAAANGSEVTDSEAIDTAMTCPVPQVPAIAIDKTGPGAAVAGATLTFFLTVYNVGDVAFREAAVDVADSRCDGAPELVYKLGPGRDPDATPTTLDPGEAWLYQCTRTTADPGAGCEPTVLTNTATVEAAAGGKRVADDDTIQTPLACGPVVPEPPGPTPPSPAPSGEPAVVPPGRAPPEAGTAGTVRLSPLRRCLRRGSRVAIRGERIASIRVFVGGRRVHGLSVRPLQHRAVIRLRRSFPPGRYRVTAAVRFHRGAGTPPLRLVRAVRTCARQAPRFTG